MRMIARIRTVVDVPFDFDVEPPDNTGYTPSSAGAANYAIDTLLPHVVQTVGTEGDVLEEMSLVEEVREA